MFQISVGDELNLVATKSFAIFIRKQLKESYLNMRLYLASRVSTLRTSVPRMKPWFHFMWPH